MDTVCSLKEAQPAAVSHTPTRPFIPQSVPGEWPNPQPAPYIPAVDYHDEKEDFLSCEEPGVGRADTRDQCGQHPGKGSAQYPGNQAEDHIWCCDPKQTSCHQCSDSLQRASIPGKPTPYRASLWGASSSSTKVQLHPNAAPPKSADQCSYSTWFPPLRLSPDKRETCG